MTAICRLTACLAAAFLVLQPGPAHAQDTSAQDAPAKQGEADHQPERKATPSGLFALLPPDSVTRHTIDAAGRKLAYTATAGTLPVRDDKGEEIARVFYTAYVADGAKPGDRPITFAFNGGPGAGSAYLQLGLAGPYRLDLGNGDGAEAKLVENPETWLDFTDLVFLDPVGTGYSIAAKPEAAAKQFWGVRQDADYLARLVDLYLVRNGRMASPKYLLGESYGGLRAAKIARALQRDQGVVLQAITMVSPLIEANMLFGARGNPLVAALRLPSLGAAELTRKGTFTPTALAEIEQFARTEYLSTLVGKPPVGEAAATFYGKVAELTGLAEPLVAQYRGLVPIEAMGKHFRAADGDIVSLYDATLAAPDPFPDSEQTRHDDPALDGFTRAFAGGFAGYAHDQLGFKTDLDYRLLAEDVNEKWDWHSGGPNLPGAMDDLRQLLALDPSLKLTVAHGYTDLMTAYGISRYLLDHLPEMGEPGRVQLKLYPGGHMLYLVPDSRRALTRDVQALYSAPK
ncbi:peptidase S10 [Aliidongia dinghuensis]|uniref:Peptidase S10 n=1 Tax=Aliidongia dinghuensis TaxID=1867774 RepID=A0A8J3E2I6_9PROT|nr:carboxypeptidase [Aliidongia dinghuensis]GGF21577.1 peptidase S10 [Aliidongia dinghuensis]